MDKESGKTYRIAVVRKRTWLITLIILITLVLYFLVVVGWGDEFNLIDFVFTCFVSLTIYYTYFPDGELFGSTNTTFITNREAYNAKATSINNRRIVGKLRDYCIIEYKERCNRYILNEVGRLGLEIEQYETLKKLDKKEFWALEQLEYNGRLIMLSRAKKRALSKLLWKTLPVEPNHPETVMSAISNDGNKAIHDSSKTYKTKEYALKAVKSILIGGFLAYIGYTVKDGITLGDIVKIFVYITNMITTAVMSYSAGETCTKVYKNKFYVDLALFIDGFDEWNSKGA